MFQQLLKLTAMFLLTRDGLWHSLASQDKNHTYSFSKKGERRQEIGWIENMDLPISDWKFRKTRSCFSQSAGKAIIKMGLWYRGELPQKRQSGSLAEMWQAICFFNCCHGETTWTQTSLKSQSANTNIHAFVLWQQATITELKHTWALLLLIHWLTMSLNC